jgi:cytochrome b561
MTKTNMFIIWHALMASLVIVSFVFADEDFLNIHRIFGYAVFGLIIIRWFIGLFVNGLWSFKIPQKNNGFIKNSSAINFIILLAGLLLVILSGITADYYEFFEDPHEFFAETFMFFVFLHSIFMLGRMTVKKMLT